MIFSLKQGCFVVSDFMGHINYLQIVGLGEKLKTSKKKQKMASASGNCQRDWGKVSNKYFCIFILFYYFFEIHLKAAFV